MLNTYIYIYARQGLTRLIWLDLGDKLKLSPTDDDASATSILDIDVGQIEGNGSKEQTLYVIGRTTPLTRLLNISVRTFVIVAALDYIKSNSVFTFGRSDISHLRPIRNLTLKSMRR
jgi:hypothetical protein